MFEVKKCLPLFMAAMISFALLLNLHGSDTKVELEHVNVTVRTGDTVWGLAEHFKSEHEDVRAVVSRIYEVNGLAGKVLRPGESIVIPVHKTVRPEILAKVSQQ